MPHREKEEQIDFLRKNIDVFSWSAYKAPAIPKKQPSRRLSEEHYDAVKEEVLKLKRARAIKEVFYPK